MAYFRPEADIFKTKMEQLVIIENKEAMKNYCSYFKRAQGPKQQIFHWLKMGQFEFQ